jgi:8-oxo-dGTP pyrophosphatase MutT (NUDIX family)
MLHMPAPIAQASVVPFRRREGAVEFCLITSISSRRWGFPKGIIDAGYSPMEAALQEAREEAGLEGRVFAEPLGTYRYQKWGTDLDVVAYLMEVTQAGDVWQEAAVRERAWLPADEAIERLDREELKTLLQAAIERIG